MATIEHAPSTLDQQLSVSDYSRLIGFDNANFIARSSVEKGPRGGNLDTLKRQPEGELDGVGYYRHGIDNLNDLDVRSSIANQVAISRRRQGEAQPKEVHLVVETGRRLPTGNVSLRGLSRLAVASTAIITNESNSPFQAIFTSDSSTTRFGYNGRQSPSPREALAVFDNFYQQEIQKPVNAKRGLEAPLKYLNSDQSDLDPNNAVVVIASDFINGAKRDNNNQLVSFNWESDLKSLDHQLGDRLKIIRLNTPSFTELPLSNRFSDGNTLVELELGDYLKFAEKTKIMATEKQARISRLLARFNVVELNTNDSDQVLLDKTRTLLLGDSKR